MQLHLVGRRDRFVSDKNENATGLSAVGLSALLVIIVVWVMPAMLLRGFILSQLWLWFAESAGLPHLGVVRAVGASLVLTMLRGYSAPKKDEAISGSEFMIAFLLPLATLSIGYVFSRFL